MNLTLRAIARAGACLLSVLLAACYLMGFDRVTAAKYTGFSKANGERILEVLAVVADPKGVTVTFAGDAALRLQGARIVCHLEDLGEPWPTRWRPSHADAADDQDRGADAERSAGGHSDKNSRTDS